MSKYIQLACIVGAVLFGLAPIAHAAFGFTPFAALNSNAPSDIATEDYFALATDGAGTWIAVWNSNDTINNTIGSDYDILYSRSTDNGATWSDRALLNSFGASDSAGDFQPAIASDGEGHFMVLWHSTFTVGDTIGSDNDIFASYTSDGGLNWSAATVVNSNAATDGTSKDEFSNIVADGDGNWVAVWASDNILGDSTRDDWDIRVARSTNNGANWTAVANLNSDAATDSTDDVDPRVATDKTGIWITAWESENSLGDTIGDDFDILFAKSTSNGANWTAVAPLNANAASDTGADILPAIATDGNGNWVAVWESTENLGGVTGTDYDVLSASSSDGATWSDPISLNSDAATDGNQYDNYAAIDTDKHGTWLATWTKQGATGFPSGTDTDLFVAKSTDNGQTWTSIDSLNGNALTDSGNEDVSAVVSDGLGHWVAVVKSTDSVGGTIGSDWDLITARTTIDLPSFTVTKPSGGKWTIGNKERIEWTSIGSTGQSVKIDLLKNGSFVTAIKGNTKNDGKQKWSVPNISTGSGYTVRVTSKSNPAVSDESDKFKIK